MPSSKLSLKTASSKKSGLVRSTTQDIPKSVHVQMPDENTICLEVVEYRDTIGYIKDKIEEKMNIPRNQQRLKIAAKPNIILVDNCEIYEYNKWNLSVLHMVLEIIPGDCYIRVLQLEGERNDEQYAVQVYYTNPSSFIMKVNNFDTIKTVKDHIMATNPNENWPAFEEKLFYQEVFQENFYQKVNTNIMLLKTFEQWHRQSYGDRRLQKYSHSIDRHPCGLSTTGQSTTARYQEIHDDMFTLQDYHVVLFHKVLKLKICLLRQQVEEEGVKHVYSVQILHDLDTASHHDPNDYLLSVEYNTTVDKLYSMVADHYKISVKHVMLMVNNAQILLSDNSELHELFYYPIILFRELVFSTIHSGAVSRILPKFRDCIDPADCELAKNVSDDPIIREMVGVRNDIWETIIKVFNITDEVRKEIDENSEDDHIRCMDVMHRMYHHDHDLTWEFVEIQVRREDPRLADVIKTHL